METLESRQFLTTFVGSQLDFSAGFNRDSIRNRSGGTDDLTDTAIDGSGSRLITDAWALNQDAANGNGLPDDGVFPASAFHPAVELGYSNDDDGYNVVFLPNNGDQVTIDVPAGLVGRLHVFALSTDGASDIQVVLNYEDGTETLNNQVEDWFLDVADGSINGDAVRYNLIDGMDRLIGGVYQNENNPAVFGHRFEVDSHRRLESFTVTQATIGGISNLVFLGA